MNHPFRRLLMLLVAFSLIVAACGDSDEAETNDDTTTTTEAAEETSTTEAAEETTTTAAAADSGDAGGSDDASTPSLVIWADANRITALEPFADEFGEANGLSVEFQELDFNDIRDQLLTAAPVGEGPDLIIGAHDWLGQLATSGVVAPLDLGTAADDFLPVAIDAMSYEGQLYGLPYAIENVALIRNTELVPEPVATWEELEEVALGLVADGSAEIPLAIQQAPGDPFHNYPLYTAVSGEEVFGRTAEGGYDPDNLTLDSEGGLAAAEAFAGWAASGLMSGEINYDVMIDTFAAGDAPFAVTGPWAVNDPDRGFVQSGVPFAVEAFPTIEGGTARPFVGVQGFMISAFAENPLLAQTFVVDFLGTAEAQTALYEAGGRPPAHSAALESVADDPIIAGFGAAGQDGAPLPAIPAMGSVWSAWTDAYDVIFQGGDATQAFTDAAEQIRNLIAAG